MYLPEVFAQKETQALHELIRGYPLATLVTIGPDGLGANHVPLHLDPAAPPHGRLTGHVPRANPLSSLADETEVLAIFHGPQSYVSPSWYPTKREHGRVVPTWNYAVVHAHGRLHIRDDPGWVRSQVESLTDMQEARFPDPWQVSDAPEDFVSKMIAALVGIELHVTRLIGKTKASQNQPPANCAGVVEGLGKTGSEADRAMARLVAGD